MFVDGELDFSGAANRFDGARELGDDAVPSAPEHSSPMFLDQPVNGLTMRPERRKRPFLVPACQTAETSRVGGEDGGQSAVNAIQGVTLLPTISKHPNGNGAWWGGAPN